MMEDKKLIERFKKEECSSCAAEPICTCPYESCTRFDKYKNMKGARTNNPNGRPRIDESEKRKLVSFRLKPETIEWLRRKAEELGISQAELIDRMAK